MICQFNGLAQVSLTNGSPSATIDFSNTTPTGVGTNTSTAYTGVGFSPNPTNATAGRLNSNAWQVTGWSFGNLNFGGSILTDDYARGSTAGAVTTGGFYAYTGAPGSVANPTLMMQPAGSDFAPGTLTLRVQNNGSTIITQLALNYNLYIRNNESRSNSFNFSYSTDNSNYTDVVALDYTSTAAADALGWVIVGSAPSRSTTITGLYITPGSYLYIRWSSADVGGSGSRDEFGLDDINMTATYSAPCIPPTTQASIPTFSNIFATQMDVNFTRGNGSGGVLIVASTSATLSGNPVSGNIYAADPNFGNGDAIGGGFAVFNGVASGVSLPASFTMTGLSGSTTYYLYVFEYDVTTPCYLTPSNTGSQLTLPGVGSASTDNFRTRASGNWSTLLTWESSPDNITWIVATLKPTLAAKSILIQNMHTVTISANETAKMLNIAAGGILDYANTAGGGYSLDIAADAAGVDFRISGTYKLYGIAPTLAAGATVEVYNGGLVQANGNTGGGSDDFPRSTSVSFFTGSVFDWNNITTFQSATVTYFPNASATDIATFRVSQNVGSIGANSNTIFLGLFEANANVGFVFTGTKTFRNGIIGTGTITQSSTGPFAITGTTARLGGTGIINLLAGGGLTIAPASVTTLISNKVVNNSTFTVDGTLFCSTNILSGSCLFTLSPSATLGIGSPTGISQFPSATGNIQTTTAFRTYDATANYIYNGITNQVTGNGLPGTINTGGSLTIANTGAVGNNTVTLTTTNTTVPILNLNAGLFEAGTGQFLFMAANGVVNGNGGNQGQSAAAGIIRFANAGTINPGAALSLTNVELRSGVNMGGGNTTIRGTLFIATGGFVNGSTAPTYSSSPASTLSYTCNCVYGIGTEWYDNTFGTDAGVPHNVTIAGATTSLDMGSTTFPREMRGDMTVSSSGTLYLSSGFGGDLYIKGNWTRSAAGSFNPRTRAVRFNGTSGNQTITRTGGGTETFAYMLIDKSAGQAVVLAGALNPTTVTVEGFGGNNILQLINGDLDLNQQTFNFTSYFNSNQNNLGIDGSVGNLTRNIISTGGVGTFAVYNSNASTRNITINRINGANASLLLLGSTVTMTTGAIAGGFGGINFGNGLTTINGTLQINARGFVTGFAPTYGTNSNLVYNVGSTFDRNVEWGATSGPGYPYNVTVQSATSIRLNTPAINGDANRAIAGNLTITNTSSLLLSTTAANTLTVAGNLQLDGTLTLPTVAGGDLRLGGNWNRSSTGVFVPNDRAVFFIGSGNSTITANNGQLFPYLYLTKNALGNTLSLVDSISISKEFGITTGTFELGSKNATLLSDAGGTASFGKVGASGDVSYSSTGRFVVERYIPTGTSGGQHLKSWQFLAVPTNGGQTVNAAWQEGAASANQDNKSGYGTQITSSVLPLAATFDAYSPGGPSMKTYLPASNAWLGISNTTSTALFNKKGYLVFVRGDRSVINFSGPNSTAIPTNLRSTGKLFVPGSNPPQTTTIPAGKFESIGNPYASAIDFMNITRPAAPAVDSVFYVWDPLLPGTYNLGGFQTISSANSYKPNPGGTANYSNATAYTQIQSGQAFLMHATGAGGTVSFTENAKVSGSSTLFRQNLSRAGRHFLRASLYTAAGDAGKMADANVLVFDQAFSNDYESNDALKIMHSGENFSISSVGQILSIEARKPVQRNDTVFYYMTNLRRQAYQFRFGPENMAGNRYKVMLVDRFLQTRTPVSMIDSTYIDFAVTTDPASAANGRFYLVISRTNPAGGNGGHLITTNKANTNIPIENKESGISVYPNPVVDGIIRLEFTNQPEGKYTIQLTSPAGQVVFEQFVTISGTRTIKSVEAGELAAGYYMLQISKPGGSKINLPVVVAR